MTLLRQYSLPNCTLILEGLNDASGGADPRPLMSMLINAECHFTGQPKPLSGGREFFESLVMAVNAYAQEFLSGLRHPMPTATPDRPVAVQIQRLDQNFHRVTVQATGNNGAEATTNENSTNQIDLTTVQLFDLVDAVDQFFADSQTLPGISYSLVPLSRRYALHREPLAKQAIPATVGASTLALAAAAFFFIPIPSVKTPEEPTSRSSPTAQTTPGASPTSSPGASPTPTTSSDNPTASPTQPNLAELEATLTQSPEITDPAVLEQLNRQLYDKVDKAWQTEPTFEQSLVYRVGVGKDGAIVGYKPVSPNANDYTKETPLLNLLYIPTNGGSAPREPIAQFRLVFQPDGKLEVSPWRGFNPPPSDSSAPSPTSASPQPTPPVAASPNATPVSSSAVVALGSEITEPETLKDLTGKLYDQIDQRWKAEPSFDEDLEYQVKLTETGAIAEYKPLNQAATTHSKEIPLSSLAPSNSTASGRLALFKVVFKPSGVLQVSPWRGISE